MNIWWWVAIGVVFVIFLIWITKGKILSCLDDVFDIFT